MDGYKEEKEMHEKEETPKITGDITSPENITLCNEFASVWNKMIERGLLVPYLKSCGYTGKLTKELIF